MALHIEDIQFTCIVYLRNLRHCVHKHSAINTMEAVSTILGFRQMQKHATTQRWLDVHGLSKDPYVIPDESWVSEADITTIPDVKWSDMFLYLICKPSPYTRDELRVRYC